MAIASSGTHIYFVDNFTKPEEPLLIKMGCPTAITGIGGGAKARMPTTCLDTKGDETYLPGLGDPAAIPMPYNFDPSVVSHQILDDMKESGVVTQFAVCLSDGEGNPTISPEGSIVAPKDRTSMVFNAYIAENTVDISNGDIVKGTASLQRSGTVKRSYKE